MAIKEASKSTHKFALGSCIIKKGKVVSVGHNKTNSHNKRKGAKWSNSIHAEEDAINNAPPSLLKRATLIVVRVVSNGDWALAKPCPYCMEYIKQVGISRVIYTTARNTMIADKILYHKEKEYKKPPFEQAKEFLDLAIKEAKAAGFVPGAKIYKLTDPAITGTIMSYEKQAWAALPYNTEPVLANVKILRCLFSGIKYETNVTLNQVGLLLGENNVHQAA